MSNDVHSTGKEVEMTFAQILADPGTYAALALMMGMFGGVATLLIVLAGGLD